MEWLTEYHVTGKIWSIDRNTQKSMTRANEHLMSMIGQPRLSNVRLWSFKIMMIRSSEFRSFDLSNWQSIMQVCEKWHIKWAPFPPPPPLRRRLERWNCKGDWRYNNCLKWCVLCFNDCLTTLFTENDIVCVYFKYMSKWNVCRLHIKCYRMNEYDKQWYR